MFSDFGIRPAVSRTADATAGGEPLPPNRDVYKYKIRPIDAASTSGVLTFRAQSTT
jgi:hypothetical protein